MSGFRRLRIARPGYPAGLPAPGLPTPGLPTPGLPTPGLPTPVPRRAWLAILQWGVSVPPEALAFLDPIDQICEAPPPRLLRSIHVLVAGLFLALLLIAALVQVDVVVVAAGRLVTDTAPIVIQPMERAIIRRLDVRPGDVVTKGQVLATLDPTFAQADVASLTQRRQSLQAQRRRLEAEASGAAFATASPGDSGASPGDAVPGPDELLQEKLYWQRRAEYGARLSVFDEELGRLQANLRGTDEDRAALLGQVDVAQAVETMRGTLMRLQSGSKLQYLEAEALRMRAERELQDTVNRLPELRHGVQSKLAERQGFVNEWARQVSESLVAVRTEEAGVAEALVKASRLNELVVVKSTVDGVVLGVARLSEGSVLREAEPLLTIIPSDATLIAEVMISSSDVGNTIPGSEVDLKVDAFPYQRHGMLHGTLLSVSQESSSGNGAGDAALAVPGASGAGAFHRGRVELHATMLNNMPEHARLFPGMTLTAEIKAGSRNVLSYFLSPITRGFSESIREP